MQLTTLSKKFTNENKLPFSPRSYFNHSVSFKKPFSAKERAEMLENYGNLYAIDHRQWGSMGVTLFQLKTNDQEQDDTQSDDI